MKSHHLAFAALSFAAACSTSATTDQTITGRIDQATFASPVTAVRAYVGGIRIDESAVAVDGSFALSVPPTTNARIELVTASPARLVFPRSDGRVDAQFSILAGGTSFNLGTVRHLAAGSTFSFHSESDESTECHDGVDASGNVCVEDDDENSGTCEDNSGPGNAEDGDGGGDHSGDDDADSAANDDDPTDSASADHNFPADGCNASDDDGSDDGSDDDGSDDNGSDSGSDDHGGSDA